MQHASIVPEKSKVVPAAGGLITRPADREFGVVAEQQRPNGPVTDDEDISSRLSLQNCLHLPHNALLSSKSGLPAPNADGRAGEERVRHDFKFGWWQVARRGAVVLVRRFPHRDDKTQGCRQDFSSLERLRFAANNDFGSARWPSGLCECMHALATDRTRGPQGYGNARIDLHLRMGQIANAVLHPWVPSSVAEEPIRRRGWI